MTVEQEGFVRALYQEHHDALLSLAKRIVKDPEAAADAVSQAYLILILKIDSVMACRDPVKWLFHVCKNTAIDEYRRQRRRALPLTAAEELGTDPEFLTFQDLLPEGLTEDEREILSLRIQQGMAYEEIAAIMHATSAACRMKYSRAKKHCADLMRQEI